MHLKEWSTLGEIQESGHVRKSYCRKFIREHLLMRFPHFSLLSPKWMQCKPERLPKVFQKSLLSLGNERQVRLPCLETVLLKAISTGWGFLCDCGVHMGETDEPHKFGKGIKQLDWTCSQCLRQYSMQVLQLCRMTWPVRSVHGERSSRFQLLHLWKSLSNQRKAVQPWVHL